MAAGVASVPGLVAGRTLVAGRSVLDLGAHVGARLGRSGRAAGPPGTAAVAGALGPLRGGRRHRLAYLFAWRFGPGRYLTRTRYPAVAQLRLTDYKVRILEGSAGTAAITRVLIETQRDGVRFRTVGASTNIIEASWRALADSIEYGLTMLARGDPGSG